MPEHSPQAPDPDDWSEEEPEVWRDDEQPVTSTRPVIAAVESRRHVARMQTRVLIGIAIFFGVTMAAIVFGPPFFGMSGATVDKLITTVLPAVLAASATIVGTLFGGRANNDDDR